MSRSLWKKILVPIDFSGDSLEGLAKARNIEQLFQTEVILLNVTEPALEGLRIQTTEFHRRIDESARDKLTEIAGQYFPGSSSVSVVVKEGRAAEVICETARQFEADVIVIASHGASGLKHLLLGDVAEKVVRHAPCSVLVVR